MTSDKIQYLLDSYGKDIYSFCCYLTGNTADAEDLYQETFLKAIGLKEKIKIKENAKSFLIGIAVNLNRNRIRKYSHESLCVDETEDFVIADERNNPEDSILMSEMRSEVRRVIDGLPPKSREILLMYYAADLSIKAIAKALHIPMGTVSSRIAKAKQMVKKRLEEIGYVR